MAKKLKTPGVYIEEISILPASISQVESAIPAFVGYTAKAVVNSVDYHADNICKPIKIKSILEYEIYFGGSPKPNSIEVEFNSDNTIKKVGLTCKNLLYDSLRLFYANGGGDCYIVSAGKHRVKFENVNKDDLEKGLDALKEVDETTLLIIPEAVNLNANEAGELHVAMLNQCNDLQDRFAILDIIGGDKEPAPGTDPVLSFRSNAASKYLSYGAAYYPWLITTLSYSVDYETLKSGTYRKNGKPIADIDNLLKNRHIYKNLVKAINQTDIVLPPGGAIAAVYAKVDRERGVWKPPANVTLSTVKNPTINITVANQEDLNTDPVSGISINAIQTFAGRGIMVCGARTLAGKDSEWRYIPVRRFFIMVRESVKKSIEKFTFEPNDINTWVKIKSMIENYLFIKWSEGALTGSKPEHSFFVNIGLGKTMTNNDILEGRIIIEIGMAPLRPAEFIIMRISLKMQQP